MSVRYLPDHHGLPGLRRMTPGSSGFDLQAACEDTVTVVPGKAVLIPTGVEISLPAGYEAQVRSRSGLALRHGIGILNSPGTIDSDYRGEIGVILYNFGNDDFIVRRGDRIAQLVMGWLPEVELVEMEDLDGTDRGSGGFGHTG